MGTKIPQACKIHAYGIDITSNWVADEAKLTNQLNHFTLNYLTNKVVASNELPIDSNSNISPTLKLSVLRG